MKKFLSLLMMTLLTVSAWAGTVTFDLTTGYSNQEEVSTVTNGDVTLTFDKGTNSNTPKWYSTGASVRLYGGGTLTVSSASTITAIDITFGSGDGSNAITTNTGTYGDGSWTGSATSVVFAVGGTTGNRRFAKVVVTLEDAPDALKAPTILLNGETPKSVYMVDELPLTLTFTSNNGVTSPVGQYTLIANPNDESTTSQLGSSFTLQLGDSPATNLKVGSNSLSVREALNIGTDDEALSPWANVSFTVKEPAPSITTVAAFNALADGTELTFNGDLTVVGQTGAYLYAQDAEKGMLIYGFDQPTYNFGDIIPAGFTGKKTTFKGAPEMANPAGLQAATQNVPPTAVELTPAQANLDNAFRYAVIRGATIDGSNIVVGEESVAMYNRFSVAAPTTGTVFDIYGVVGYYNTPQFMPLQYVDVTPQDELTVTITPAGEGNTYTEPVQVTITASNPDAIVSYKIDNGEEQDYTAPFTLYASATVTAYATDGDAIAEATQNYNINLAPIAVTFTPAAGTYTSTQHVKVAIENTFGDEVLTNYYLNNEEIQYDAENGIEVAENATITVEVMDVREEVAVFTAEYVINEPEPTPASGTATIVFGDNGTDATAVISSDGLLEYITEGANYVANASDIDKVYKGTTGLKFSSSKANGTITLNFAKAFENVTKVEVNARQYGTDAAQINGMDVTEEFADYTIAENLEDALESLTLTATKRVYVKSITITWSEPEPETVTVTGTVTDAESGNPIEGVTVTITKNTANEPETPAGLKRAQTNYTGTTDANGAYSIDVEAEEGATYNISFAKEGYVAQTIENIDLENVPNVALAPSEVTGINDITVAEGNVKYVDAMGRVSNRPFQGMNIVIKADGSVSKMVK